MTCTLGSDDKDGPMSSQHVQSAVERAKVHAQSTLGMGGWATSRKQPGRSSLLVFRLFTLVLLSMLVVQMEST